MNKYKSLSFDVTGMHCTACSVRLEKKLNNTKGIYKSTVNFASGTALVQFEPSIIKENEIVQVGVPLGYTMSFAEDTERLQVLSFKKELVFVILSWLFTLVLVVQMFQYHGSHQLSLWGVIVAGATLFIPGFPILKSAFFSATSGILGMDVLIALGAFAAWISSFLPFLGINVPDYSMTASMLIAVNLTGRLLETMARGSASKAVNMLANFSGKHAHRITETGAVEEILISELQIGDRLQIKAGEKIPTDGTILEGSTSVDESFLTGESLPIDKQVEDYVYGGAINLDGFIVIRVEKDSKNNILAQTIKLIQEAQGTKVPIQIFADKITSIFVPIILTLAFLCFAIWFAFPSFFPDFLAGFNISFQSSSRLSAAISASISVLVIACPCALGLATPMALVNGSTLGAKKGILIRNGSAVQNICDVDLIALDKTGTLTMGKPQLTSFMSPKLTEQEAVGILAGLEVGSTHPLANAIIGYAKKQEILVYELDNISNTPGQGVFGVYQQKEWFAGSLKSSLEQSLTISDELQIQINKRQALGETLVCLSDLSTNNCEAIASFSDTLNPEAQESIQQLKLMGKKIMIITGDHKNAAQNISQELDIKSVIFEASPKKKLDTVKSLQEQNYKVCFVGDGVNDAAALESAHVGIAIGTGTDIAAESGDIILVTGSLTSLVLSFKVALATFQKIKQNLFWAFFYNFIAIPIAFMGLLSPIIAEIAMTLSSLIVIGNSILLSHKKLS
ncbi:MAG: heavy metal translocating P-type ATPase [Brevinema sp.]